MEVYFDFEVSLRGVKPMIWRRFLLRDSLTFESLHLAIQDVCGWSHSHGYAFHALDHFDPDGLIAGEPEGPAESKRMPEAARVKLRDYIGEGKAANCFYQYDFGDDWWHEVRLLGTQTASGSLERRLLEGARAFPPEDCGGAEGYMECVQAALITGELSDRGMRLREWLAGWHPDAFDLAAVRRSFDR